MCEWKVIKLFSCALEQSTYKNDSLVKTVDIHAAVILFVEEMLRAISEDPKFGFDLLIQGHQ